MTLIAITCGLYACPHRLIDALSAFYHCKVYGDPALVEQTGKNHDLKTDLILKSIQGRHIPFDNFTHDRKKCLAALKLEISENILNGPCIFSGILSHLIPASCCGMYRIMSPTPMQVRIQRAIAEKQLSGKSAAAVIARCDHSGQRFACQVSLDSLWDPARHNMVLEWNFIDEKAADMTQQSVRHTLETIQSDIRDLVQNTDTKGPAVDFNISSRVDVALSDLGHHLIIESDAGHVLITLDRKVMDLARAQKQIMELARLVPGVKTVKTKIGPNFYKGGIIPNLNLTTPFKRKT